MSLTNFVISVRNVKNPKSGKTSFGNEPGKTRYLEVPDGEIPHPTQHLLKRNKWVKAVRKRASIGKHPKDPTSPVSGYTIGDVLVFVHGYNNSIEDIMHRHDLLQKQLRRQGFEGAIVSYDWPSANATLNYSEDRSDAQATAHLLVNDGISILARNQIREDKNKCDIDVHLLGHSTGAYVIREAFYEADRTRRLERINWKVSQIVFIAGDIGCDALSVSDSKSGALYRHATRITNYQNPYDSVLKLSNAKRFFTKPRVGRSGLPHDAPASTVNVNVGPHWLGLKEDDSNAKGHWAHSWHFDDPVFAKDLAYTLAGDYDRHVIPTRKKADGELVLTDVTPVS